MVLAILFNSMNTPDFGSHPVILAEEAGFEPAVGLTLRTLSRRMT